MRNKSKQIKTYINNFLITVFGKDYNYIELINNADNQNYKEYGRYYSFFNDVSNSVILFHLINLLHNYNCKTNMLYSNSKRDVLTVFLGCLYFTYSYSLPEIEYSQRYFFNAQLNIGANEINKTVFQLIDLASTDLLKINTDQNFYNKQLNKLLQFTEVMNYYYDEDIIC